MNYFYHASAIACYLLQRMTNGALSFKRYSHSKRWYLFIAYRKIDITCKRSDSWTVINFSAFITKKHETFNTDTRLVWLDHHNYLQSWYFLIRPAANRIPQLKKQLTPNWLQISFWRCKSHSLRQLQRHNKTTYIAIYNNWYAAVRKV